MKRYSGLLATAIFLLSGANTDVTIVTGEQLRKLIVNSQISSDPVAGSVEQFAKDGEYRHLFSTMAERGTYTFEGNNVCTFTPRKICKRVVRDKSGRYLFISATDSQNRAWPISIKRLHKEK